MVYILPYGMLNIQHSKLLYTIAYYYCIFVRIAVQLILQFLPNAWPFCH